MVTKPLLYRDVDPTRYIISDNGRIFKIDGTEIFGNNPNNEKGYIRIGLVTTSGKIKKYSMHRLVLAVFTYDSDLEVDHINGDKKDNNLQNLEYVTGDENKRRASVNLLYKSGEDHHFSVLTNDQVHSICELFEKGYNIRKVIKILGLESIHNIDMILTRILYRDSWKSVSRYYSWDVDDIRLKVYKKEHLKIIARLILESKLTYREIAKMFPQYKEKQLLQVIKKMGQGKLYKSIIKDVRRSTTTVEVRDGAVFLRLARKR